MSNQSPPRNGEWTEDPRYAVSRRELAITAAFFVVYTVVTIGVAWLIGGGKGVDEIDLVWGFPAWFFWSTLVLGAAFCVIPYFIVKYLFTDMSLEADPDASAEGPTGPGPGDDEAAATAGPGKGSRP